MLYFIPKMMSRRTWRSTLLYHEIIALFLATRATWVGAFTVVHRSPSNAITRLSPPTLRNAPYGHVIDTHHKTAATFESALLYGRDADMMEMSIGGMRYEMVELPDSMMDTTLFVGNLCEFVTEDMLSKLFQEVSTLQFIPACIVRKPNMSSLKYGFATFPNEKEKMAAINRFAGYELNNKPMRIEEIRDNPKHGRVRVPDQFIFYSAGAVKRTRDGTKNTMRMARIKSNNGRTLKSHSKKKRKQGYNKKVLNRGDLLSSAGHEDMTDLKLETDVLRQSHRRKKSGDVDSRKGKDRSYKNQRKRRRRDTR